MIRRQIDQHADRGVERRREIDLIGRALDDVYAIGVRRLERKDRRTDIAAELRILTGGRAEMCSVSAVVVDLPLVPVMATNGACGRVTAFVRGRTARCRRSPRPPPRAQAPPTNAAPDA